jgi:transcriptional regulator with XRE-family HTH domain
MVDTQNPHNHDGELNTRRSAAMGGVTCDAAGPEWPNGASPILFHVRYIACMEQTTPPRLPSPNPVPPACGPGLEDQLWRAGYNMAPRGGGQRAFATDAGITPSVLSRLLRGEHRPEPDTLRRIAETLGIPVAEMFVRAGLLTPDDLAAVQDRTPTTLAIPPTPEQAVADLGITDPAAAAAIIAAIEAVRPNRPDKRAEQ